MFAIMKQKLTYLIAPFALGAMLTLGAAAPAAAVCLSGGEIQTAISSGQIAPLNEVTAQAGIGPGSTVLQPVAVCDDDGPLAYYISVLDKDGNARKLVLPAGG